MEQAGGRRHWTQLDLAVVGSENRVGLAVDLEKPGVFRVRDGTTQLQVMGWLNPVCGSDFFLDSYAPIRRMLAEGILYGDIRKGNRPSRFGESARESPGGSTCRST